MKTITTTEYQKQDLKEWCKAHIYLPGEDTQILINRKEIGLWLEQNWDKRFATPILIKLGQKQEEFLIRNLHFKPAVTLPYEQSLNFIELMHVSKILGSKNIKVRLNLNYQNVDRIKFGIFTVIKRYVDVYLKTLNVKILDINVPKYINQQRRHINIFDLPKNENYEFVEEDNSLLCKLLRSSKERRSLHTQWLKRKQVTRE